MSSNWIFSTTRMVTSSMECSGRLKCAPTGFSARLCRMSDRWPLRQMWRAFSVSPTYCFLHLLHSIKYTRFFVLQVAVALTWWDSPVTVLQNVVPVQMCWQVLQRLVLQGLVPSCAVRAGFSSALTSRSRMFRGRRYAKMGNSGMASLSLCDRCSTGKCCFVIFLRAGSDGW